MIANNNNYLMTTEMKVFYTQIKNIKGVFSSVFQVFFKYYYK